MSKIDNKNTRKVSYFTPFYSVSIVEFEQVNVCLEILQSDVICTLIGLIF